VPLGTTATDRFTVPFDPQTDRIVSVKALPYRDSESETKILWIAAGEGEKTIGAAGAQAGGTATWADKGAPWAHFEAEDIRYNVDVDEYSEHEDCRSAPAPRAGVARGRGRDPADQGGAWGLSAHRARVQSCVAAMHGSGAQAPEAGG
jgi:hypothetical protein